MKEITIETSFKFVRKALGLNRIFSASDGLTLPDDIPPTMAVIPLTHAHRFPPCQGAKRLVDVVTKEVLIPSMATLFLSNVALSKKERTLGSRPTKEEAFVSAIMLSVLSFWRLSSMESVVVSVRPDPDHEPPSFVDYRVKIDWKRPGVSEGFQSELRFADQSFEGMEWSFIRAIVQSRVVTWVTDDSSSFLESVR